MCMLRLPSTLACVKCWCVFFRSVYCFAKSGLCYLLGKLPINPWKIQLSLKKILLRAKLLSIAKNSLMRNSIKLFVNFLTMATSPESGGTWLSLKSTAICTFFTSVAHAQLLVGRPGRDLTNVILELNDVEKN